MAYYVTCETNLREKTAKTFTTHVLYYLVLTVAHAPISPTATAALVLPILPEKAAK